MSQLVEPISGPVVEEADLDAPLVRAPRLARHSIVLADGHKVGIAVAGHGIPLVVVHGFSAEGFLYAQTLSRLVAMGFKVIAIDTAGHGGTQGLPADGQTLAAYSELLGRIIDELGIRQCILAGHSMGGRLVTQLAADRPDRTIAVLLIDAIVGDTWDKMVYLFRLMPPLLGAVGLALAVDTATVVPLFNDPRQAAKFLRLLAPTAVGHMLQPWRLAGPMISILRSRSSRYALNELAEHRVPVVALHGSRDLPVPVRTAEEAVRRTNGTLVRVDDAGHSWMLRDPETLPAIIAELMAGQLGDECLERLRRAGLSRKRARDRIRTKDIEKVCYDPDARVLSLTPIVANPDSPNPGRSDADTVVVGRHREPRYGWMIEDASDFDQADSGR